MSERHHITIRPELRGIFDRAAGWYDDARPGYPEELFDDLVEISEVPADGRILEIGPGTGKATMPLARRGFRILGIELGEQLARTFRQRFVEFSNVEVAVGSFETFPIEPAAFDLVMAATSFHWLEQPTGYQQCYRALKPAGSLVIFRHEHVWAPENGAFFDDTQAYYEKYMPGTPPGLRLPKPEEVPNQAAEIEESGLFGPVEVRRYIWNEPYDAESYLALLSTYSNHMALEEPARQGLFEGIANLIDRKYGGNILKTYMSILHVAQRRS